MNVSLRPVASWSNSTMMYHVFVRVPFARVFCLPQGSSYMQSIMCRSDCYMYAVEGSILNFVTGTLKGVGGGGVGDYTSLNRPYWVLIMGTKAPYSPSPYPHEGPYDFAWLGNIAKHARTILL